MRRLLAVALSMALASGALAASLDGRRLQVVDGRLTDQRGREVTLRGVNARVEGSGAEFCRELPFRARVVAIPTGVFYDSPVGDSLVRFAFCKRESVIDEAAARLAAAG